MDQENQVQNEAKLEKVEKKHNYFYRITNQINWKYYFGIHSTDNLDDNYAGSGKILKNAINCYGKENFHKCIIADFPTRKEASDYEKLAVTMIQVEDENCYNLRTGGDNEFIHSEESKKKMSEFNKGKKLSKETKAKMSSFQKGRTVSEETRKKISNSLLGEKHHMFGKSHTPETKKKMSESHSGDKNHMFGKFNCNPKSKPCMIHQVVYASVSEASRQLNISFESVKHRILSTNVKFKDWGYCE